MSDLAVPQASRLQRPSWKDARLVVGVLLVLLAVVLGARAVSAAGRTVPVYVAAHALVPGHLVDGSDLRTEQVRLSGAAATYLSASRAPAPGTYVLRAVPAGELVPRSALGSQHQLQVKTVSVPIDVSGAGLLARGSIVDVWVDDKSETGSGTQYHGPQRVLSGAIVAGVPEQGGGLSIASTTSSVQIVVPDANVQQIIAAVDAGAKVTLVPVAGSAGTGGS